MCLIYIYIYPSEHYGLSFLDLTDAIYFGELRQKMLQNIPRKFDKITQSTKIYKKYFEDNDVHDFNINTNPDRTTYTVSEKKNENLTAHQCIF